MKVKERIYIFTDEEGRKVNLEGQRIAARINGAHAEVLPDLNDLFVRVSDIEGNEVIGFSLLHYFLIKDGLLVDKEGNTVQFILPDKKISLKVQNRDVKFVPMDPVEVPLNYIMAFSRHLIGIKDPAMLFTDLTSVEKKAIEEESTKKHAQQDEAFKVAVATADAAFEAKDYEKATEAYRAVLSMRDDKHSNDRIALIESIQSNTKKYGDLIEKADGHMKKKQYDEAKQLYAEAAGIDGSDNYPKEKMAEIEQIHAEAEQKAKINPKFLYEQKEYDKMKNTFDEMGGQEKVLDSYHLLFVPDDQDTEPLLLIKRGKNWWEEPEEGEVTENTEDKVAYRFKEADQVKIMTVDIQSGQVSVIDEA